MEKTKIVIFRKGGRIDNNFIWTFEGKEIEIVNTFNYLGVVFSSGGSFSHATKTLSGKGIRAMNTLFQVTNGMNVPVNIMFNLFDAYVLSILNHSCEVWGFLKAEDIERVHRKFCKWLLNVKMTTNTLSLYSELGRFPLYINRYVRIVKHWLKLYGRKSDNCIIDIIVKTQRQELDYNDKIVNWSSKVRDILQNAGFAVVWTFPESVDIDVFIPLFHTRLRDIYILQNGKQVCTSLSLYRQLKTSFIRSDYLNNVEIPKYRNVIAKLRLNSHNLKIESGRHRSIERNLRLCTLCNTNDLEDEYHFVLVCPFYNDYRKVYIQRYFRIRPSMYKFIT